MKKLLLIFLNILFIASSHAVSINVEEPRTIVADKIEYDVKSETIKTSGTTEITNQSGQRMTLTDSYISGQGSELSGEEIKLWLGNHVYVESSSHPFW